MDFPDDRVRLGCTTTLLRRANQNTTIYMKQHVKIILTACLTGLVTGGAFVWQMNAADSEDAIKEVMQTCHKAPEGTDPICKKALDGKASAEELKKLVAGYKVLTTVKPPKGDEASWKDKTSKLLAAAQALQKGESGATAQYKTAVDCKACHSVHKPK
jgi:hypothetical protein